MEALWQKEAAVAQAEERDRAPVARRAAHRKADLTEAVRVRALLEAGRALQATPRVAAGRTLRHRNRLERQRPAPAVAALAVERGRVV